MCEPMDADVLLICVDHVYMIYIYMVVVVNIYMIGFYMYLRHKPLAREATSFSYCTAHIKFQLFHQGDHYFLAIVVCVCVYSPSLPVCFLNRNTVLLALRRTSTNRALFITYLIATLLFLCWVLRDLLIQLQLTLGQSNDYMYHFS